MWLCECDDFPTNFVGTRGPCSLRHALLSVFSFSPRFQTTAFLFFVFHMEGTPCLCEHFALARVLPLHPPGPCVWAAITSACPDCGAAAGACSFLAGTGPCQGLTWQVNLCLLASRKQVQRRTEKKISNLLSVLAFGATPSSAVVNVFHGDLAPGIGKNTVTIPKVMQSIGGEEGQLFVDKTTTPWRFALERTATSSPTTISRLLSLCETPAIAAAAPAPCPTRKWQSPFCHVAWRNSPKW